MNHIEVLMEYKYMQKSLTQALTTLSGSSLRSNASNPFRMVRICIWMLQVWFEIAFECFESLSNG